ncbi:hypothetical protein [Sphingomonas oryzagri]
MIWIGPAADPAGRSAPGMVNGSAKSSWVVHPMIDPDRAKPVSKQIDVVTKAKAWIWA